MKNRNFTFIFPLFFLTASVMFAQLQITSNPTITQLVAALAGNGATITNPTLVCPTGAYATFSNGQLTNLGINSGVLLTTGTDRKSTRLNSSHT